MARVGIGPMILASAILAVPVLAATPDNSPANANPSAAATAPQTPPGSAPVAPGVSHPATATPGMTAERHDSAAPASAANQSATPKYMTSDNQVRVGKMVGATVYNDKNESVGSIDDVLMSHDNKANTAVISVGGFLGMGSKLVSVPFDKLQIEKDKIIMPGATKDALKDMPEYKYNNA